MMDKKNNTGDFNSGDRNTGDRNIGDWNSGGWNIGDCNSGYWNSGDRNSGHSNSGDWNSGDCNSGYLCTDEPPVRIFNKETDVKKEDIVFPDYFMFELSKNGYKDSWVESFEKASVEDVRKTLDLPNFDFVLFEEISGISKGMIRDKLRGDDE